MRGLLRSVLIMTLLVCGVQSSAQGAEFDTMEGIKNVIENVVLDNVPGGDFIPHIMNLPQYTKTGLIVWLNRKMADAASAGEWKKHDRYLAFYTCISKNDCGELRVLNRQGGGTIHRAGRSGVIEVISATYGWNCKDFKPWEGKANTVDINNARAHIAGQCNGKKKCQYTIYYKDIGDPAYGCEKDYEADYRCSPNTEMYDIFVEAEAGWGPENKSRTKTITLSCE